MMDSTTPIYCMAPGKKLPNCVSAYLITFLLPNFTAIGRICLIKRTLIRQSIIGKAGKRSHTDPAVEKAAYYSEKQ
jgi:hypothetical protein